MKPRYRGRFAPTPSGPLHFGSLVTAFGSYLEARAQGGEWWLRIDDVDAPRVQPGAIDLILRALEIHGLTWDGPVICQSSRRPAYHAALHALRQQGHVYPCACGRTEITRHARYGPEGAIYPDICREGMPLGARARSWRLRCPDATLYLHDAVQGSQMVDLHKQYGDFPLYRADGVFSFHLTSALDDLQLGMTDIVRGSDLLPSSLRQVYLRSLLAQDMLTFAHLPVVLDEHGEKLSKQTLAHPLDTSHAGDNLVRALAFLGHRPPPGLARAPLSEVHSWACAHWRLDQVPRLLQRPESDASPANASRSEGSL